MTLALAIKEDASAEDKVSPQFVVAIAEILPGVTWDHTVDGRTGAAVRCAAIAASKVATAAIGASICGDSVNLGFVPFVQITAWQPYAGWILSMPLKDSRAEFIQVCAEVNAPDTEGPMKRNMCANHWSASETGYGDLPTSVKTEKLQYMDENNVNPWVVERWSDLFCMAAMVSSFKYRSNVSPELDSLKSEYLCHSQQAGRPLLSKPLDYLKTLVYPCLRAGAWGQREANVRPQQHWCKQHNSLRQLIN